jgi:hypothetical protein
MADISILKAVRDNQAAARANTMFGLWSHGRIRSNRRPDGSANAATCAPLIRQTRNDWPCNRSFSGSINLDVTGGLA